MGQLGYNHGDIGWMQLNTADPETSINFYQEVFGWDRFDGPVPEYKVFGKNGEMMGGVTGFPEGCDHPAWIPYITVADLDSVLEAIKAKDCQILMGPDPLPDGGRIFVFADPQGAPTGVAQYGKGPDSK